MLKTFVTATAIGGLMLSSALAQSPPSEPPAATPAPETRMPATPAPGAQAQTSGPQFIAAQKSDQWLATKFSGTDVLGPQNEKIGDVNDVLFDKTGKVVGLIVGVGGFLGIGQKDVAIDMGAFQAVSADTNTGSGTAAPAPDDPNNVKLKVSWTKEQLQQAPSFERYKAPARTTGTAPGNTGTRPGGVPTR